MIPPRLATALSVYDEAALVLMANKGLYRRALRDKEDGKIAISASESDSLLVNADGDTVRIDARGPKFASCTCSAPGICRHRLAAVLFVQAASGEEGGPADSAALDAEIAGFTTETLRKWAGKAAWQAALELIESGTVMRQAGAVEVSFPNEDYVVRILAGQGLDGMVSKVVAPLRKTYHVAAVLAARRSAGVVETEEIGVPTDRATPINPVELPFLVEVETALAECTRVAFNLAPFSLEERMFRLSVSSKVEAMPRLSAMLRAISRHIRNRRNRNLAFDVDECLETCASAFALVHALRRSAPGEAPHLYGVVRQEYALAGDLSLAGCAADVWTTVSGARGITGYFYQEDTDRWVTVTMARASGQDASFDPQRAYRGESIWGGGALSGLCGSRILLNNASVSADGRLSTGQASNASVVGKAIFPEALGWPTTFDDWALLRQRLVERLAGAPEGRAFEPVLLKPHRFARPTFDDLAQVQSWPVEDSQGRWTSLSLEHGRDRDALVEAAEKMAASEWSGTVVALGSIDGHIFRLRPIAFGDGDETCNLGLDDIAAFIKPSLSRRATHLMRDVASLLGRRPRSFSQQPPAATVNLLRSAWQVLIDIAEMGVEHHMDHATALDPIASRMADAGFPTLSQALAKLASAETEHRPTAFLTATYALNAARRLTLEMPWLLPA